MTAIENVCVVLPSLDPDEKLLTVIDGLLEYGFQDILLVNDGSKPENLHHFETAAQHPQVTVLHHPENRGKGAALKTAFRYVLENRPEIQGVVTVDGDNQHHPADTRACTEHMLETGRITLGVRDFSQPGVPARSRSGNRITSLVFKLFVGMVISDTQTGLRAIPRSVLSVLTAVGGDRFEFETNMLLEMKRKYISFEEINIRTVYIEENKSSHFRAVRDSIRIYKLILAHFFRYIFSSCASSVVDIGLFYALDMALIGKLDSFWVTMLSTVLARFVSSLLNFYLNRRLVFRSHGNVLSSLWRYFVLAIPQMGAQAFLTWALCLLLGLGEEWSILRGIVYMAVMVLLFFFSFLIQQRWVFNDNNKKDT